MLGAVQSSLLGDVPAVTQLGCESHQAARWSLEGCFAAGATTKNTLKGVHGYCAGTYGIVSMLKCSHAEGKVILGTRLRSCAAHMCNLS